MSQQEPPKGGWVVPAVLTIVGIAATKLNVDVANIICTGIIVYAMVTGWRDSSSK